VTDPALSKRWLKGDSQRNQPTLVIGRDDANALLVGYQSRSGKRLLFRSAYLPNGAVLAEVLHWNSATRRIERLIEKSDDVDPSSGKRLRDFKVNGVNLFGHLKAKRDKRGGIEGGRSRVAAFLDADDGETFLAAVPALYAAIEDDEISERQPNLKKPFGVLAMMLQMSGERYKGLPDVEYFANNEKRRHLSDSCAGGDCQMRGKTFVIHKSGFFNVISKPNKIQNRPKLDSMGGLLARQSISPMLGMVLANSGTSSLPSMKAKSVEQGNEEKYDPNSCFGRCGSGCGAIDIRLPECSAHDWCECRFGAAACALSAPTGCATEPEACGPLIDAVIAVGEFLFAELFNLLENTLETIAEFIFEVLEFSIEVVNDLVDGLVDVVEAFLDWVFGDPSCEGESAEAC